jgi:sec-independent protein translocase protein TatA
VIIALESIQPVLLFLDISFGEIFIIVAVIFIIFGPQKIPEIARKVGKGMREVRKASTEIKREINREVNTYKTDLDMERMVKESGEPAESKKTDEAETGNSELEEKSE